MSSEIPQIPTNIWLYRFCWIFSKMNIFREYYDIIANSSSSFLFICASFYIHAPIIKWFLTFDRASAYLFSYFLAFVYLSFSYSIWSELYLILISVQCFIWNYSFLLDHTGFVLVSCFGFFCENLLSLLNITLSYTCDHLFLWLIVHAHCGVHVVGYHSVFITWIQMSLSSILFSIIGDKIHKGTEY